MTSLASRQNSQLIDTSTGESILPAQLGARHDCHDEPLRRLMFAVLHDAVRSYQRGHRSRFVRNRIEFYETHQWLFSQSLDGPFSLASVCGVLNIDPRIVRTSVLGRLRTKTANGREKVRRRNPVIGMGQISKHSIAVMNGTSRSRTKSAA